MVAGLYLAIVGAGCGPRASDERPLARVAAPVSRAADATMRRVPAGPYVAGSTEAERAQAYADAAASAGDERARRGRWFANEAPRRTANLPRDVWLDRTHVTNEAYAEFVAATGRAAPAIDEVTWRRQGYIQDYAREVVRFAWAGGRPPAGRARHPVLLVTWEDARAYCAWRGAQVGAPRRLPTAAEVEKAMRGDDGRVYPWGETWDPTRLNWAAVGDTEPVGSHPEGAGPYGHEDLAGLAFVWTADAWRGDETRATLKGSAWDDVAGVGRGAAWHGRPKTIRHAIVGFRCAGERPPATR
jgi:formylglycine-generating enzyme required for sulfatase activity